ncbi:MAG: C25 family cysteine peptidase [Chloroflexota bacterium]|nr:C25 family cysteine peptidase [Chloroflexota bacterium]
MPYLVLHNSQHPTPLGSWKSIVALLLFLLVGCSRVEAPLPPEGEPVTRARVTVEGTGLFVVEPKALARLGWSTEEQLTLLLNGEALPYQSHQGALYFYIPEGTPSRYSKTHNLWLVAGETPQPVKVPVSAGSEGASAEPLDTVIVEQRLSGQEQYSPKYVGDPWFWRTLAGPATDEHELETPGRQAGTVTITVRAGGVTNTEHRMAVLVEGEQVGSFHWFGDERHEETLSLDAPAADALALSFVVPESTEGADISMLDEVVLHYPSTTSGVEGPFVGTLPQAGTIQFERIGEDAIAWQIEPVVVPLTGTSNGDRITLAPPPNQRFVVTRRTLAQSASVERANEVALPTEGADYLAIVAPPLVEAVEPLLAFHRDAGLSTMRLTPQQVYDAYSHGMVDPMAFHALLSDAQERWETKPRFVLLVGDSTYDPQGYQSEPPAAYLPSPFVETVYGGETVSDNHIADLDDDGYPDVALGRLPARTPEQLGAYIEKRLAYSNDPTEGAWRQRVLLAADGQEALFKSHSEQLRDKVPQGIEALTVYPEAQSDALAEMLPFLNEGSLVVNYVGHGSVQQWGKDQLLTTQNASELTNGSRLPIYINMTCLAGLFSHPKQESLAESLLWSTEGGAVAAVAPTSLTLPTNQTALNEALLQQLLSAERPTIGEALDEAKRAVSLNTPNDHDIVATFNLLGDPALRPAPPPNSEG